MRPVNSILIVLSREGDPSKVIQRGVRLARCFKAHIELFLCEAECAYVLEHQYHAGGIDAARRASLAKSRAWLERIWRSLDVSDLSVSMEAVCETPQYEAVRRKVERSRPDLVIRGIGRGSDCTFSASDADLVRTCPAPLLLTRGRPWKSRPTVAAALDISGADSPELIRTILLAAEGITEACGASLELVYAMRPEGARSDAPLRSARDLLTDRAAAVEVHPREAHVLIGEPVSAISEFVAEHSCDFVVLGALTHRDSMTALVGTLTGYLVETLECDLLLVRPPSEAAAAALSAA
jgi:universal stress protein E